METKRVVCKQKCTDYTEKNDQLWQFFVMLWQKKSCMQTKMYRLYRKKMTSYGNFSIKPVCLNLDTTRLFS